MEFEGTVANGVVVVQSAEPLPEGTRVRVFVPLPLPERKPTLSERLLKHAGTVEGLPADLAAQHDHYLHGTPRR